jgi:hypothetical protein
MQPIPLEPGMRVRCVRTAQVSRTVIAGENYTVHEIISHGRVTLRETDGQWIANRFKPIVRVKMGSARSVGGALVNVTTRVGSIELGTMRTRHWIERAHD